MHTEVHCTVTKKFLLVWFPLKVNRNQHSTLGLGKLLLYVWKNGCGTAVQSPWGISDILSEAIWGMYRVKKH